MTRDAQAQDIVAESMAQDLNVQFADIADGNYFLRVTAIDSNRLEGLPEVLAFTVKAKPEPPFPLAPKHKVRIASVEFKWTQNTEAQYYRLQVAQDQDFKQIVLDQDQIRNVNWSTDKLAIGDYYWRIASVQETAINGVKKIDQGPLL